MKRLLRHRSALVGGVLVALYLGAALSSGLLVSAGRASQIDLRNVKKRPSVAHLLGTDELGRDMLARVVLGARVSLAVSLAAVGAAMLVGTVLGLLSALAGAFVDQVVMRVMDCLLALPGLLLAIFAVSILGFGLPQLVVAIAVYSIPTFARLARASALIVRETEYVTAARAVGVPPLQVARRHVLPNILSPLIVQGTLRLATANLSIASLGFLGLGAQPPTPEWGLMIAAGRAHLTTSPHILAAPSLALLVVVLGFNLLGDGLRDLLDPRLRRQAGAPTA